MTNRDKLKQLVRRHKEDEKGSMGVTFSLSLLVILMAAGTTFDINQLQTSASESRTVADAVGLTASIYVKNHGKPPRKSKDGYVHNKVYSAKKEGLVSGPGTRGNNDVKFKVLYDETKGEARVEISGRVQTSFMGVFGHDYLTFNKVSVVKYAESDVKDPASVFLVMDNSGSMRWDDIPKTSRYGPRPAGAQRRIDGLRSSVTEFNDYLAESVSTTTKGKTKQFLRTGMAAYHTKVIPSLRVTPHWGILPQGTINRLSAGGGTDSRSPMTLVEGWMKGESKAHEKINGTKTPLKYVIFMTDGVNNQEYVCDWQNRRGTQYWRRRSGSTWQYRSSWRRLWGWQEGRRVNCRYEHTANKETIKTCNRMKKAGVEIYTIGYALEPGMYVTDPRNSRYYTTQDAASTKIAYDFLAACATDSDHFVKAEDTAALKKAFDKIGQDIIADVVRVAS